jgi:hypothetical protein
MGEKSVKSQYILSEKETCHHKPFIVTALELSGYLAVRSQAFYT